MAQQNTAADENRTSIQTPAAENEYVEVALSMEDHDADHPAVQPAGKVADHPSADTEYRVAGTVVGTYNDTKYLLETELGTRLVVDRKNGYDGEVREFDSGAHLGRPVYQVEPHEQVPEDTEERTSEDWAVVNRHPSENSHYVSTTGNITRHCVACGYEGTHDHPRRSRPTFHADLTHHCPHADCGARLHGGPAEDCEDCQPEDDDEGEDDEQPEVATDGGVDVEQGSEAVNPHQHTSVWVAATNLECHEDGSAPRLGVEYRKKNGRGTSRFAGTVEQVEVERPSGQWTHEVEQPTPRIVFRRDDGQRMYVEPDGLYTVGSHAPYVGAVVSLTTSTTSTATLPEGSTGGEREAETSEDSEGSTQRLAVPSLDAEGGEQESRGDAYVAALAEWAERHGLRARTGSTHYSWDLPGFGRQNDPHSGRCATSWGGEKVYVTLEGERSEAVERVLAQVAHRDDLEVSASQRRVTLVPPAGV